MNDIVNQKKKNNEITHFHDHGKKVKVGKDQEKAQSEKKDSHSNNRGGKIRNQVLIP